MTTTMTEQTKHSLFEKNTRIIEAVKSRAARLCPGALDMIAVTGSFATGDYHEKSDLDLLIVVGDESGDKLSHCFILGDVGYDLYCHTWGRLEHAADYDSPYVSKLLDAVIVYCREESVRERFDAIAERLKKKLAESVGTADISHAKEYLNAAKQSYFDMAAGGEASYCYPMMNVVYQLECAVYLLNHAVVRHGVRGICAELADMPSLPENFLELHASLFEKATYESHMHGAMTLIQSTERWIAGYHEAVCPRQTPCADNLRGTYEELFSNYRNKLIQASEQDNRYLAQMTLASAALFFAEIGEAVAVCVPDAPDSSAYADPVSAAGVFARAMEQIERVYASVSLDVCRYDDVSAFEGAYISDDKE